MRATITEEDLSQVDVPPESLAAHSIELIESKALLVREALDSPVEEQKEVVSLVKVFLLTHMKQELFEKGYLTDFTRRWVKDYNDLLDKLQKNIYGEKSVNLHLHKVTHAHIASEMRKYSDEQNNQ